MTAKTPVCQLFYSHPVCDILFTGERGLEICSNGARSPISMDLHTSRPSGNSWHHTTGTNSL